VWVALKWFAPSNVHCTLDVKLCTWLYLWISQVRTPSLIVTSFTFLPIGTCGYYCCLVDHCWCNFSWQVMWKTNRGRALWTWLTSIAWLVTYQYIDSSIGMFHNDDFWSSHFTQKWLFVEVSSYILQLDTFSRVPIVVVSILQSVIKPYFILPWIIKVIDRKSTLEWLLINFQNQFLLVLIYFEAYDIFINEVIVFECVSFMCAYNFGLTQPFQY